MTLPHPIVRRSGVPGSAVRAVLSHIAEPTEAMMAAAVDNRAQQRPGTVPGVAIARMYRAMIDVLILDAQPVAEAVGVPEPTARAVLQAVRNPDEDMLFAGKLERMKDTNVTMAPIFTAMMRDALHSLDKEPA